MDRDFIIKKTTKYYSLPIPDIPELYDYFLDLYEPLIGSRSIIDNLIREIGNQNAETFFDNLKELRMGIVQAVEESEAYKEFNSPDNPKFIPVDTTKVPLYLQNNEKIPIYSQQSDKFRFTKKYDVYSQKNDGRYFVSIDIEKAGFQVLKKYNPNIVFGADTYDEFIKKFSDSRYLVKSRYFRQVIFKHLSPRRQNSMQRYFTGRILDSLIDDGIMDIKNMRIYTHDELVFNADGYLGINREKEITDYVYEKFGLHMHVKSYRLKNIWKDTYAKEFEDGSFDFKCVPTPLYAQIYKKYMGLPIIKKDLACIDKNGAGYFSETIDGKVL